jgi:hypothetical protein
MWDAVFRSVLRDLFFHSLIANIKNKHSDWLSSEVTMKPSAARTLDDQF